MRPINLHALLSYGGRDYGAEGFVRAVSSAVGILYREASRERVTTSVMQAELEMLRGVNGVSVRFQFVRIVGKDLTVASPPFIPPVRFEVAQARNSSSLDPLVSKNNSLFEAA